MANIFEQTIVPKVPFSNFELSETQIITHNFGQLVPCYVREILPNDIFSLSAVVDTEFAPMVAAMKQDVNLSVHFFFVPDRILFDDFETFITGSEDGHALTTEAELARMPKQPGFTLAEFNTLAQQAHKLDDDNLPNWQGSILDYLGLPNNLGTTPEAAEEEQDWTKEIISDLPLRAYWKIWYDFYRDENLQVEFTSTLSDKVTYYEFWRTWKKNADFLDSDLGQKFAFGFNRLNPFYRSYRKDYFTGALPTPQKGEPVTINLGGQAPVTLQYLSNNIQISDPEVVTASSIGSESNAVLSFTNSGESSSSGPFPIIDSENQESLQAILGSFGPRTSGQPVGSGYADLSRASAITVEALREAFAVQEILESLSIRGSRFPEFLRGNFGVTPDDYRLQRPQFLGGLVTPVAVQKVIQTSGYSGQDPRDMTGYAAGRAFAAAGRSIFRQRFKEYGYIIGIMSVMPKAYYYQGIPRHFLRHDRFDYYLPQTAHLGEQPIENQELFFDPENTNENNTKVFGFIPRWAEYKVSTNGIHGDFRGNLNYYHMARIFGSVPTLSEDFITTRNVQTRPFAVWQAENPSINHLLWTSCFFKVTGSRPMPYHSIPKVM